MIAFGQALPALRARVAADLARVGLPRAKATVLATYVVEKGKPLTTPAR